MQTTSMAPINLITILIVRMVTIPISCTDTQKELLRSFVCNFTIFQMKERFSHNFCPLFSHLGTKKKKVLFTEERNSNTPNWSTVIFLKLKNRRNSVLSESDITKVLKLERLTAQKQQYCIPVMCLGVDLPGMKLNWYCLRNNVTLSKGKLLQKYSGPLELNKNLSCYMKKGKDHWVNSKGKDLTEIITYNCQMTLSITQFCSCLFTL